MFMNDNQCAAITVAFIDAGGQPDTTNDTVYTIDDPTVVTLSGTNPYDSSAPPADVLNRLAYYVAAKPGVTTVHASPAGQPSVVVDIGVQVLATADSSGSFSVGPISTKT